MKRDELLGKIGLIREWGKANWELLIADVLEALVREVPVQQPDAREGALRTPLDEAVKECREYAKPPTEAELDYWESHYNGTMGERFPVGAALRLIAEVRSLREQLDLAQTDCAYWRDQFGIALKDKKTSI